MSKGTINFKKKGSKSSIISSATSISRVKLW
jgi:hypothetical protein